MELLAPPVHNQQQSFCHILSTGQGMGWQERPTLLFNQILHVPKSVFATRTGKKFSTGSILHITFHWRTFTWRLDLGILCMPSIRTCTDWLASVCLTYRRSQVQFKSIPCTNTTMDYHIPFHRRTFTWWLHLGLVKHVLHHWATALPSRWSHAQPITRYSLSTVVHTGEKVTALLAHVNISRKAPIASVCLYASTEQKESREKKYQPPFKRALFGPFPTYLLTHKSYKLVGGRQRHWSYSSCVFPSRASVGKGNDWPGQESTSTYRDVIRPCKVADDSGWRTDAHVADDGKQPPDKARRKVLEPLHVSPQKQKSIWSSYLRSQPGLNRRHRQEGLLVQESLRATQWHRTSWRLNRHDFLKMCNMQGFSTVTFLGT